jgi:5'-nucleotidase
MIMKTILCDMDGILVDLSRYWLKEIEKEHGVSVTQAQIDRWDMHKCGDLQKLGAGIVYSYLQRPGFFLNAPALPGALESLKVIKDMGHDVVIVSTPSGPISAKEKLEWLATHVPWLKPQDIMLASRKTLVNGDFLIDDHPTTLMEWGKLHPNSWALGIRYPYNTHLDTQGMFHYFDSIDGAQLKLFNDFEDSESAWIDILDFIGQETSRAA